MFRSIILALTVASASAFMAAPRAAAAPKTVVKAFESEIGAQPPLGCWDPLGLLDKADQERFDRLRYVEIKHGRICMLGVAGFLTTAAGVRLPGDISYAGQKFSDIHTGWAGTKEVPIAGALQILLFIGFLEICVIRTPPTALSLASSLATSATAPSTSDGTNSTRRLRPPSAPSS